MAGAVPSFGVKIPQKDFLHFPAWMRLGDWLGGALQWHLTLMVARHGWSNFYSMLTGWKSDPDYLVVHSSGRG